MEEAKEDCREISFPAPHLPRTKDRRGLTAPGHVVTERPQRCPGRPHPNSATALAHQRCCLFLPHRWKSISDRTSQKNDWILNFIINTEEGSQRDQISEWPTEIVISDHGSSFVNQIWWLQSLCHEEVERDQVWERNQFFFNFIPQLPFPTCLTNIRYHVLKHKRRTHGFIIFLVCEFILTLKKGIKINSHVAAYVTQYIYFKSIIICNQYYFGKSGIKYEATFILLGLSMNSNFQLCQGIFLEQVDIKSIKKKVTGQV